MHCVNLNKTRRSHDRSRSVCLRSTFLWIFPTSSLLMCRQHVICFDMCPDINLYITQLQANCKYNILWPPLCLSDIDLFSLKVRSSGWALSAVLPLFGEACLTWTYATTSISYYITDNIVLIPKWCLSM